MTPKLPYESSWGSDYPDEFRFRDEHGFDERESTKHHSWWDEHYGSSVYRKPAVRLDEDDEREAA